MEGSKKEVFDGDMFERVKINHAVNFLTCVFTFFRLKHCKIK